MTLVHQADSEWLSRAETTGPEVAYKAALRACLTALTEAKARIERLEHALKEIRDAVAIAALLEGRDD